MTEKLFHTTNDEGKHELDSLKGERNYKGCLVRRIIGGYDIWGIKCSTPQEVDEAIDRAGTILSESIVYPVTIKAGNSIGVFNTDKK